MGDLGGPYPLSLAIVWVNAALVLVLDHPRRIVPLLAAAAFVAAIVGYGLVRAPQIETAMGAAHPVRVGLVQGNVSIEQKSDAAYFKVNVDLYRALSAKVQDQVDLLVWPETVAQWWTPADARTLEPKHDPFPGLTKYLVYGGLAYRYTRAPEPEALNSAFLLGPGGQLLGRYDKHILMPFGEYMPGAQLLPFIKDISPHTGDLTPGRTIDTFSIPGATLGPLICYEDIVTGIPMAMTRAGAQVLFNILNDAWFGNSAGPYEHQALALWRAVENRRYLLRDSNSGVTSIIDPLGRVVGELGLFRDGVLLGEFAPAVARSVYTRIGDALAWALWSQSPLSSCCPRSAQEIDAACRRATVARANELWHGVPRRYGVLRSLTHRRPQAVARRRRMIPSPDEAARNSMQVPRLVVARVGELKPGQTKKFVFPRRPRRDRGLPLELRGELHAYVNRCATSP